MNLTELLKQAVALGGSDIFFVPGAGVTVKINNDLKALSDGRLMPDDTEVLVRSMYELARRDIAHLDEAGDDDFSFWLVGGNDTGEAGTVGTFDPESELAEEGEPVVEPTDAEEEYDGTNMYINFDDMAQTQSYLFLGIPQSHQAYNFLIAMLYSQLYGRLYELGERKLRGKYHIGYRMGTPVFDYFDSYEEAETFYKTVTEDNIVPTSYVCNTEIYNIMYNAKSYKTSVLKAPLKKLIQDLQDNKMVIWAGDDYAGGDPSLPIHINFLLDEFKNIGEIPNFLTILSTSRKYRIGSHVVIQDIGQLKTMYKDGEHETVMANVDTTIFLGSILKEDKEQIQKILGKTTIRQKSTSSSNSGLSTSYTPTEVDLMSIDEIGAINENGRDDELVIIRDVTPYLCRKLNLTEHRRWSYVQAVKEMKDDNGQKFDVTRYYTVGNDDL